MLLQEIFYSISWICMISTIWFYTDWFIDYCTLLGVLRNTTLEFFSFIAENPNKYFPDFLYEKALAKDNQCLKFLAKLATCPLCMLVWLSVAASIFCGNLLAAAPIYIISLLIVLQIKNLL